MKLCDTNNYICAIMYFVTHSKKLFLVAITNSRAVVMTFYKKKQRSPDLLLILWPPESSALA